MMLFVGFRMKIVLTHKVLVAAGQCLHRVKDFYVSCAARPVGLHKKLGGNTARTAYPG